MKKTWLDSSSDTPRVGGSATPGDDLVGILGMDASALSFQLRYGFGPEVMDGFTAFFNLPSGKRRWTTCRPQLPAAPTLRLRDVIRAWRASG